MSQRFLTLEGVRDRRPRRRARFSLAKLLSGDLSGEDYPGQFAEWKTRIAYSEQSGSQGWNSPDKISPATIAIWKRIMAASAEADRVAAEKFKKDEEEYTRTFSKPSNYDIDPRTPGLFNQYGMGSLKGLIARRRASAKTLGFRFLRMIAPPPAAAPAAPSKATPSVPSAPPARSPQTGYYQYQPGRQDVSGARWYFNNPAFNSYNTGLGFGWRNLMPPSRVTKRIVQAVTPSANVKKSFNVFAQAVKKGAQDFGKFAVKYAKYNVAVVAGVQGGGAWAGGLRNKWLGLSGKDAKMFDAASSISRQAQITVGTMYLTGGFSTPSNVAGSGVTGGAKAGATSGAKMGFWETMKATLFAGGKTAAPAVAGAAKPTTASVVGPTGFQALKTFFAGTATKTGPFSGVIMKGLGNQVFQMALQQGGQLLINKLNPQQVNPDDLAAIPMNTPIPYDDGMNQQGGSPPYVGGSGPTEPVRWGEESYSEPIDTTNAQDELRQPDDYPLTNPEQEAMERSREQDEPSLKDLVAQNQARAEEPSAVPGYDDNDYSLRGLLRKGGR